MTKIEKDTEGNDVEVSMPNLYNVRNRALLKELVLFNPPYTNVDRVMAMCMVMLYRQEKMILYQGNMRRTEEVSSGIENDDYWSKNYRKVEERKSWLASMKQ